MAEVSVSNLRLASDGNRKIIYADLSSIDNADTFTVPHLRKIDFFSVTTSTDDDVSGTVSANVITFACGAQLAGMIKVEGW